MRDAEVFARDVIQITADQSLLWHVGDGMHDAIQSIPVLAEALEQGGNFFVAADIAGEQQCGIAGEFVDQTQYAVLHLLALICEGQFSALAVAAFGDAVGNRTVAEQTGDENLLASEKAHESNPGK